MQFQPQQPQKPKQKIYYRKLKGQSDIIPKRKKLLLSGEKHPGTNKD